MFVCRPLRFDTSRTILPYRRYLMTTRILWSALHNVIDVIKLLNQKKFIAIRIEDSYVE